MGSVGPLLLLFALAGGYTFLHSCHFTKHRWDALEWERNLFEAALFGGAFFGLVRIADPLLEACPPLLALRSWIHTVLPFPYIGSFIGALFLGVLVAGIVNLFVSPEAAIRRAVDRHGGELLKLLQSAAKDALPVSLTMGTKKAYVGFVLAPPGPKYPYTKILPTMSGYRDPTTQRVMFTTPYWHIYQDLQTRKARGEITGVDFESFGIVLPIEQICSANLFDDDSYRRYFGGRSPMPPRPDEAAPNA